MIPRNYVTEWRAEAPWVQDFQVEQDLVISRALVEIFSRPHLRDASALRGGTALYKLYLAVATRYSEDVDLVQTRAEPAGPTMEALCGILDPWLGTRRWKQTGGRVTFMCRFDSEATPAIPLRLKVEINTREHFTVYGLKRLRSAFGRGGSRAFVRSRATTSTNCSARGFARCISASRVGICSTSRPSSRTRALTRRAGQESHYQRDEIAAVTWVREHDEVRDSPD